MAIEILLLAWSSMALGTLSPGPNSVAVVSTALSTGLRAAIRLVTGVAIGGMIWALSAIFGLSLLLERYPWAVAILGVCGGLYLGWMGVKALLGALKTQVLEREALSSTRAKAGDFFKGLSVTLTNPKAGLVWISVTSFVVLETGSTLQALIFTLGSGAIVFTVYSSFALLLASPGNRARYKKTERWINALFGLLFLAIGASMIWQYGLQLLTVIAA